MFDSIQDGRLWTDITTTHGMDLNKNNNYYEYIYVTLKKNYIL